MDKHPIPKETIDRLFGYLRPLMCLRRDGKGTISSPELARLCRVAPSVLRKDFSYVGRLGTRGVGYNVDEVIRDLGLDRPQVDPTTLTQDEMIAELQRALKAMLGYGARLPKSLLLFVKNLIFLDGAIATLAPELDLLGEVAHVATHFATKHGASIAAEVGMDPSAYEVDLDSVKDAFGIDRERDTFTYAELRKRRELIRRRLHGAELSLS